MRRFGLAVGVLLVALCAIAFAQKKGEKKADKPAEDNPAKLCEQLLTRLQKGDKGAADAFDGRILYNELAEGLEKELPGVIKNASNDGKAVGFELASKQTFGESFLKLMYLSKYERGAISWTFLFYRPQDKWMLYSFHFTGDITALLQ